MPRGDRTGPMGMGPMTGRGMGYCNGFTAPGYANGGSGMGRGRGYRRMYAMTGQPGWARCGANGYGFPVYNGAGQGTIDEKEALKNQAAFLEKQLDEVRERLKGLDEE